MTTISNAAGERIAGPDPSGAALLDVKDTARLIGASTRSVYRLSDAGKMPPPVRLGGLVRWRRAELADWIIAGCPSVRTAKVGR